MRLKRVKNIPLKLRREIYKIPVLHSLKEQSYQKALDQHSQFLPQLDDQGRLIVDRLRHEGTCMIPIEQLQLPTTEAMMTTALCLADQLRTSTEGLDKVENCEVAAAKEDLREFPEMLLWALEPRLLDIIENYIGLPILYQGFGVRRSIADGQYSGVRRWHMDWEDRRIIKVIIYLNDVAPGGGPYEYIPRQTTAKAIAPLNYYNLGYLSDAEMLQAVPQEHWQACLEKKGSVLISDTSSVFHRAQPPTDKERFSITFCYTSDNPQVIWRPRKISRQQWEIINNGLSQRQRDCLPKRRFS